MENKFLIKGALKLAETKFNTLINGKPDPEVVEFRTNQCKNCPLLNGRICNPDVFKTESGDTIEMKDVNNYIHISDSFGIARLIIHEDKIYYRGCGCPIFNSDGTPNKPDHYFDEKELEKKDGTGPCPMGKWSKKLFEQYIKEKYESDRS